jgi:S1-C subfamily serine protease
MVPAHVVHRSDYYWIVPKHVRDDYLKDTQRVNREIQLKPEMGKGIDEVVSIRIASIDQHSPMFAAGFRTGDQILEVNGAPVSTLNRAVNLVNEVRKCEVLTARVQRAGSVVSFKCEFP